MNVLVDVSDRVADIRPLPFVIHREYVSLDDLKRTYIMGENACFFEQCAIKRPFPSNFRVNWRMLNVDGFHYTLMFEPVKYRFSLTSTPSSL